MPSRALCTPVGPAGLTPGTVLCTQTLVARGQLAATLYSESHVVPARNRAWQGALAAGVERVLWMDADVTANPGELAAWLDEQDVMFDRSVNVGAVGAVVARRGGGWAFDQDPSREVPLYLGMGLVYWDVTRVRRALDRGARPEEFPFQWVAPWSEDYDVSRFLHMNGAHQAIDARLATSHQGVGSWHGGDIPPRSTAHGGKK